MISRQKKRLRLKKSDRIYQIELKLNCFRNHHEIEVFSLAVFCFIFLFVRCWLVRHWLSFVVVFLWWKYLLFTEFLNSRLHKSVSIVGSILSHVFPPNICTSREQPKFKYCCRIKPSLNCITIAWEIHSCTIGIMKPKYSVYIFDEHVLWTLIMGWALLFLKSTAQCSPFSSVGLKRLKLIH